MENTIVNINYEQTGASTGTNPLGMREMQAKVYEAREKQYLLVKEDYPDKTLQNSMTPTKKLDDLREAHHKLVLIVESCYQDKPFANDEERLNACLSFMRK